MIEQALARMVEREEERALSKIDRMWNADEGRMGIELPPLNIALVEVHKELATVQNNVKDMICKNKMAKKAEKYANQQLEEAQKTIAKLEHRLQEATTSTTIAISLTPELQKIHEEVEAQMAIVSKAKKLRKSPKWKSSDSAPNSDNHHIGGRMSEQRRGRA